MESGEKREVTQENPVVTQESPIVIRESLNEDSFVARNTRNEFYGGIDLKISKIRVISDNPIIIE